MTSNTRRKTNIFIQRKKISPLFLLFQAQHARDSQLQRELGIGLGQRSSSRPALAASAVSGESCSLMPVAVVGRTSTSERSVHWKPDLYVRETRGTVVGKKS